MTATLETPPTSTGLWSKIVLEATREKPRRQEASAVQLHNGDLLLLWSEFDGRSDNARATTPCSPPPDEGGPPWPPPPRLPQEEPYTPGCHDRLTVLDNGRLIAPLH